MVRIGQNEAEGILPSRGGEVWLGKIELLLGANGSVAAHKLAIQIDERVAVGIENEFPRYRPALPGGGKIELRPTPGEGRDNGLAAFPAGKRRRGPYTKLRVDLATPHGCGKTLDLPGIEGPGRWGGVAQANRVDAFQFTHMVSKVDRKSGV